MSGRAQAARVAARGAEAVAPFPEGYLELLGLVERLHRLLLDVVKDEFERLGLLDINAVQGLLLFNVGDAEVTAGELKSRGYYQGSNVSYNLKKLVEAGYLHHQRSEQDRRAVRIRLTDRGRFIHDTLAELFEKQAAKLADDSEAGEEAQPDTLAALRRLERFWREGIRYIY